MRGYWCSTPTTRRSFRLIRSRQGCWRRTCCGHDWWSFCGWRRSTYLIADLTGLERLDEIATHEITTAMGIGPYDLSMDLGVGAQMDHAKMKEAIARIRAAALRAGKSMWHRRNKRRWTPPTDACEA